MNRLTIFLLSAVVCSAAQAECTGNYNHSICTFDNGDTHTITRTLSSSGEEITEIKGHNKISGATWEERTRVWGMTPSLGVQQQMVPGGDNLSIN